MKTILSMENRGEEMATSVFKTYYKAIVTKQYGCGKDTDETMERIESTFINL